MAHSESHALHGEAGHGGIGGYVIGFVLAVALTAAAFGGAMQGWFGASTPWVLAALAVVQIVVHLVFFLHMSVSTSGARWNALALAYTALAAMFLVFGTVWVMHNVSMNMMSR
ncbi:cytochrome o ubiquinol oxidase subunit IV [Paraburkholderia sp. C35]|uniref:cytochrome o ubiquinol oxidase subunit IV n=1 Tax=Paraburkholderia sp. C35 TaxID=2126993 RepID=UPI000D69243E|nr:cytochrome o ubiquinol oxidase subunit IV [Paraburkholderia sp. C35]